MMNLKLGETKWLDLIQISYSDDFFHSQINSRCQINSVPTRQGQDKLISLISTSSEGFVSVYFAWAYAGHCLQMISR